MSTAQELFNAQCELGDAETRERTAKREHQDAEAECIRLRTKVARLRELNAMEEQERLASYPIADRDGYESAELYARDRREAQRIVEPEPPIERGRRDRGAWE